MTLNTREMNPNTMNILPADDGGGPGIYRGSCSWFERPLTGNSKGDFLRIVDLDGSIFSWDGSAWANPLVQAKTDPVTGGITFSASGQNVVVNSPVIGTYQPELVDTALDLPGTISGLALWLDAADTMYTAAYAAKVSSASDTVSIWPDKSGNALVATPSGSPKYSPTGHNGHPAVAFNTNSYFTIPSLLTSAFDSAFTLFIVASRSDATGNAVSVGTLGTKNFYAQRDTAAKTAGLTASGLTPAGGVVTTLNSAFAEMYVYDGSKLSVFADGFSRSESTGSLSSVSGAMTTATTGATGINAQTLGIGALDGGTFKWPGTISEVILYSSALSDADQKRVLKYLAKKWGVAGVRPITTIGDSLTSGTGSSGGANQAVSIAGTNYPAQLWSALGAAGYSVRIDAYPGRTLAQVITDSQLSTFVGQTETGQPISIVWAGTNSLTIGKSAGAAIQQLQRECLSLKQSGHKVIVVNCLPRGDAIYAGFESDRATFNAFVAANYTKFADAVANVAGDARLQTPSNATYFNGDLIHLTDAGYAVVTGIVKPIVLTL